jgi:hypothetical protein
MCEDHAAVDADGEPGVGRSSRRTVLTAAALSALSAAGLPRFDRWWPSAAAASIDGAYSMAMHIHSSFSEKYGSMDGQLFEAARNNVDVIWWTDHDTKMSGITDKNVVHFTSLTNETTDGTPWQWQQKRVGSLTSASAGGIVSSPASPRDTIAQGSL